MYITIHICVLNIHNTYINTVPIYTYIHIHTHTHIHISIYMHTHNKMYNTFIWFNMSEKGWEEVNLI